jgi:hypothetical protein
MDGRKNNKGTKGNKGGNPGYGKQNFIKSNVKKHQEEWWTQIVAMMKGDDKIDRKFALVEFNKLQLKMCPQNVDLTSGGKELVHLTQIQEERLAEQIILNQDGDNTGTTTPVGSQ